MANEAKTLKEVREMNYWQATSYFVDGMHYTDDVAIKYMHRKGWLLCTCRWSILYRKNKLCRNAEKAV